MVAGKKLQQFELVFQQYMARNSNNINHKFWQIRVQLEQKILVFGTILPHRHKHHHQFIISITKLGVIAPTLALN